MSLDYIRAGIAAVAVALVLAIGWVVLSWRDDARQLEGLRQQLQDERAARSLEIEQAATAGRNYHDELETLRARPAVGPVRLCSAAPAAPTGDAASRADDPPATAGVGLQGTQGGDQPGPDIGSDLDQIAARCDEVTAQLRSLQGWERAQIVP